MLLLLLRYAFVVGFVMLRVTASWAVPPSPTPAQMSEWRVAAEARISTRNLAIERFQGNNTWGVGESIMSRDSAIRYLQSLNRLERRYPSAVPQAEKSFSDVLMQLHLLDVSSRGASAELKKDAAFRYFDQHNTIDSLGSGLNSREVLALAWAASKDQAIFSTPQEIEDRTWGLLESLANIQRAHNDCLPGGEIQWDPQYGPDSVSCEPGKFKRLVEFLDQQHPDVQLNPRVVSPSPAEIAEAVLQAHLDFARTLSASDRHAVTHCFQYPELANGKPTACQYYVARLKIKVRETLTEVEPTLLDAVLAESMESLFERNEWITGQRAKRHPALNEVPQVLPTHPRYDLLADAFKALGPMYEFHVPAYREPGGLWPWNYPAQDLILSGVAPRTMNQRDAVIYCSSLGGGSRLPTQAELIALSRAMGSNYTDLPVSHGYLASRVPGMDGRFFWSASELPGRGNFGAFVLYGYSGNVSSVNRANEAGAVRCVR